MHAMMHAVALTRFNANGDAEFAALASLIGASAYDVRLKLAAGLPAILATLPDAAGAATLLSRLKQRGHGGLCYACAAVPKAAQQVVIRELLQVGPDRLVAQDLHGKAYELPYCEITGLIRAMNIRSAETTVTTNTKKLALGRAVLTGGLMTRKNVEQSKTTDSELREQVLYAFRKGRPEPWVLREQSMHYQGMGPLLQPTTPLNFQKLVGVLRSGAPQAHFDARLLNQKRRPDFAVLTGPGDSRTVQTSNADENALAAYLLVEAHLNGEL